MTAPLPDRVDVIVVGAGLAGLETARLARLGGASVCVLEARDRVGGRTLSIQLGQGRFDLGGQWIGPTQDRLAALAAELAIPIFPTYTAGKKILDQGGRVSTYESDIPSLPVHHLIELQLLLRRLDKLTAAVPPHDPLAAPDALALDGTSLEAWKQQHIRSRQVHGLLDVAVRTIFGAECSELSLLHFLFYLRSGGGLLRLAEIKNGAQQDRFVPGAQSLALGLAARLEGEVHLAAPVRRIVQDPDGVAVTTDRGTVRGRRAVIAVPPALAVRIDFHPALPAARDQLLQRLPMGATVKTLITYDRPFWRERGLSGEVVATSGSPVSAVFDNTSHDARQPALVTFTVGRAARAWGSRPAAGRTDELLAALARWFGADALSPADLRFQDWAAEPWSRGCPVAIAGPGVLSTAASTLRAPVGRLHFAGTETATIWNGYLEGALESAERASRELLRVI